MVTYRVWLQIIEKLGLFNTIYFYFSRKFKNDHYIGFTASTVYGLEVKF